VCRLLPSTRKPCNVQSIKVALIYIHALSGSLKHLLAKDMYVKQFSNTYHDIVYMGLNGEGGQFLFIVNVQGKPKLIFGDKLQTTLHVYDL